MHPLRRKFTVMGSSPDNLAPLPPALRGLRTGDEKLDYSESALAAWGSKRLPEATSMAETQLPTEK